jgi:hypothetical protein
MGLSVRDILILDYFEGKPVHTRVPAYQEKVLGKNAGTRIHELLEEGWIRHTRPQETVNMLPDKALSDFLAHYGLDSSGSHVELVRRVIQEIPEADYAHVVPKLYIATTDGRREMNHHMAYILNARFNYGLTEGEIGEAQAALTARGQSFRPFDILLRAFHQKENIFTMGGEWTHLRNLYFTMGNFYVHEEDNRSALSMFYLVFLIDMSGLENHNRVVAYEDIFPTQKGIILLMDQLRNDLGMTLPAVKVDFLSSIARLGPRLPFSYFSPQVMSRMLIDRLSGHDFDRTRYLADVNMPDPSATAYHYQAPLTVRSLSPDGRQNSRPGASFAIHRHTMPAVPPVMRMPRFTAPPPFRPGGERRRVKKRRKPVDKKPVIRKKKSLLSRLFTSLDRRKRNK